MNGLSAHYVGRVSALSGFVVVAVSSLIAGLFSRGALLFGLWALLPYGLLWLGSRHLTNAPALAGAGIAVLAGEIGIRLAVFVFPSSSTAAIALVFSPLYLTLLAMPAGWAGGWGVGRIWRASTALGAIAALVFATACGLFSLSLARPDLTPWAVWQRRDQLARIGPPGVVANPRGWVRSTIDDTPGWIQTAELDGAPGDEIAVADHHGILLLDPATFEDRERLQHGSSSGSRWSWYSRLARFEERLVVVQTGGGYQETEVLELDGRRIWRYRPRPELPPSTLQPWELDGDDIVDLVAIDGTRLVRLDQQGRELWERTIPLSARLLLAHAAPGGPAAWIVTQTGLGFEVWDAEGNRVGSLAVAGCRLAAVLDLAGGRRLMCGSDSLRGYAIDGRLDLEIGFENLAPVQAVAARLIPREPPHLVVVSAAPRNVNRWRLVVHEAGSDGRYLAIVYDEVLDAFPTLLVARRSDGGDRLLVWIAGAGLWDLGPGES